MGAESTNLGILAGGGVLPGRVAAAAVASGRGVFVLGLEGFADPRVLAPYPHEFARLGAALRIRELLRTHACRDLVLVGAVRRPSLSDLRPDALAIRLLGRIGRAAFAGDDRLLTAVVRVLNEEGFTVVGADSVLRQAVAPAGLLSRAVPDTAALLDVERGSVVARALGAVDVGQGCVVQQGIVLAVEAAEGTDAMLVRAAGLGRAGPGGVLVKLVKQGQERRTDLPTLGPETVRLAASAGLRGIAFEAGGTLIVDREATIAAADGAGLFLLGLEADNLALTKEGGEQ